LVSIRRTVSRSGITDSVSLGFMMLQADRGSVLSSVVRLQFSRLERQVGITTRIAAVDHSAEIEISTRVSVPIRARERSVVQIHR
jgi:hypothetical protein